MSAPRARPALPGAAERQPHARAVLGPVLAGGPASHAYLFHGPPGSGKADAARALAAELLGRGVADPVSARDRAARDAHPDLTWVRPSGAHELLVGDVDEAVVAGATRTPFEARSRVFVLERTDTLNDQAANRMLKTLEEPPSFVHLVLLTDRLGEVLPTIASRCQLVRFDPAPPDVLRAEAERAGAAGATAEACARLAQGDASRARLLATAPGTALRSGAEGLARAAVAGALAAAPWRPLLEAMREDGARAAAAADEDLAVRLEVVPKKEQKRLQTEGAERAKRARRRAERESLSLALLLVALWFRDAGAVAVGAEDEVLAVDRIAALREDAAAGAGPLRAAVAATEEARTRLLLNVSEDLLLEALGTRLARELAGR